MQVPLAVVLDALLRDPPWLRSARGAALTLAGGCVVLAGFFGVNAQGGGDEQAQREQWEQRQQALQRELDFELDEEEEEGGSGGREIQY